MKLLSVLCLALLSLVARAQTVPAFKYGKITVDDLQKKVYSIDTSANAIVIADIGDVQFEGNSKGWFSLIYKHHKRVHILNKNGNYQADIEIPLYKNGDQEEELESIKAITYNLENGKIVETKLEKSNILKEKRSKNLVVRKFTFPNVKEGSIIEFEYKVKSDFLFNLQPWSFQGSAPRLWSEFRLSMPQFLNYVFLSQGYQSFFLKDKKDRANTFTIRESNGTGPSETFTINSGISDYRWAMKDVPELKKEGFTSTLDNHIAKIEFQLAGYQYPLTQRDIMGTWAGLSKDLLKSEYFGSTLGGSNFWLGDVLKPVLANATTDMQKAQQIFAYVRDNIVCKDHSAIYMDQSLKNVIKSKTGNVSEVNLLLTAMLRYANIAADPVILSTSDNGFVYSLYPIISRFNYVITQATIGGKNYFLDASKPRLGFGKLMPDVYNGHARVINEVATPLGFTADSLKESKLTSVFLRNTDQGKWEGRMQQTSGYFESYSIRNKLKEKGQDEFLTDVKKGFGIEIDIKDPSFDSLERYEDPVKMSYVFNVNMDKADILYINPMFGEGYKQNPFKSAERYYPVEMPYTFDETYVVNMEVPKGYVIDELPKQVAVKLNEAGEGYFEYLISQSNGTISLRSRIKMQRTNFSPDEYDYLREFFKMVVTKHNEQIVFKKAL